MGYKKGETLKSAFETYTVESQIGAGGSGEVYLVHDSENGVHAAKILDPAKANTTRLKRFKNEIHFCTKNTHRNIIQVSASGITDRGATFYVMPHYPHTLRDLVTRGVPQEAVLPYFGQILDGVEAAHLQSVWHRDLKPENILVSDVSNSLVVADFGISHFEEEDLLTAVETKNDERLASFLYSAPEQRSRGLEVSSKADIYALGLILNEMFTGSVPQGTEFRKVSDVAREFSYLDGLNDMMLRQDPVQRPSISDVKRELIARGNEFLAVQRLNSLKSEVIPDTEVDDPFIRHPIKMVATDYRSGYLVFTLSATPPPLWIEAFHNPRASSWGGYQGAGPEYFQIRGTEASVPLGPGMDPNQLTKYTESYIENANLRYRDVLLEENRKRIEKEKAELKNKLDEEERRNKILSQLKRG